MQTAAKKAIRLDWHQNLMKGRLQREEERKYPWTAKRHGPLLLTRMHLLISSIYCTIMISHSLGQALYVHILAPHKVQQDAWGTILVLNSQTREHGVSAGESCQEHRAVGWGAGVEAPALEPMFSTTVLFLGIFTDLKKLPSACGCYTRFI